jgi:hypothetical protein
LIGLPVGIAMVGFFGGLQVIVVSELFRYFSIFFGQRQQNFSFGIQDLFATVGALALVVLLEALRSTLGFGTSFESVPIHLSTFLGVVGWRMH